MTTFDDTENHISPMFSDLSRVKTRGELGEAIYGHVSKFSFIDLHILGSALQYELSVLPSPYREMVEPYMEEELLGRYYRILAMHSDGSFGIMTDRVRDRELFEAYCRAAIGFGHDVSGGSGDESLQYAQLGGLSYFLLHCFALFVLEEPGHPVGMLFPGGSRVEYHGGEYYCPARGREKDGILALCEFCPARPVAGDYTN
jgi:hypothetical protein